MKFIALSIAALAAVHTADAQAVGIGPFNEEVDCAVEAPGMELAWFTADLTVDEAFDNTVFIVDHVCGFEGEGSAVVGTGVKIPATAGVVDYFWCLDPNRVYSFLFADLGEPDELEGDMFKLMFDGDIKINGMDELVQMVDNNDNVDVRFGSCGGGVIGDPHFMTLGGRAFDFHGQCDMVMMSAPGFLNGVGLDVHARTQARYEYSYVETAAIKIGNDILEVSSYGATQFNGVADAKFPLTMGGVVSVELTMEDKLNHVYTIDLGHEQKIVLKAFKDLVSVKLPGKESLLGENFSGMFGLSANSKDLTGRSGQVMEDAIEFGMEWQVRDTDPSLFQNKEHFPQWPEKCVMPKITLEERRRLGEVKISEEQAKRACEVAGAKNMEACVYDVLATGELDMAGAGVF